MAHVTLRAALTLLALVALLLLGGCAQPAPVGPGEAAPELETIPGSVWNRWRDPQLRVVCWVKNQAYGSAVSCLPEQDVERRP